MHVRKSFQKQKSMKLEPSAGVDPGALKAMRLIWCSGGGIRKVEGCAGVSLDNLVYISSQLDI